MKVNLSFTAPHIHPARDWQQTAAGRDIFVLYREPKNNVEVGIRRWPAGISSHECGQDLLCYCQLGTGAFRSSSGEMIEIEPGTLVHFKTGWLGTLECPGFIEVSYMACAGGPGTRTPVLRNVLAASPLTDWGIIPGMIEGVSNTAGILLSRESDRRAESGVWTCTPGQWHCEVTSDEYCHFLEGSCTYTHENGEKIVVEPDTLAFFPKGWKGTCRVDRAVRKVYMIR